jgi:hypothetical protein
VGIALLAKWRFGQRFTGTIRLPLACRHAAISWAGRFGKSDDGQVWDDGPEVRVGEARQAKADGWWEERTPLRSRG